MHLYDDLFSSSWNASNCIDFVCSSTSWYSVFVIIDISVELCNCIKALLSNEIMNYSEIHINTKINTFINYGWRTDKCRC